MDTNAIRGTQRQYAFYLKRHRTGLAQGFHALLTQGYELVVPHGQGDDGVLDRLRRIAQAMQAVFMRGLGHVDPAVVHAPLGVVALHGIDEVHHFGVAQARAGFLEGQAQHQHLVAQKGGESAQHELYGFTGHMAGHAVVNATVHQVTSGWQSTSCALRAR